ncbi:MAG TPA: D-alanine--D-alanine ligase [Anaerolineae bacterium]|nr:D-alanine--D-alanine ligase [Anaerolineae bacterium]
MTSKKTTVGLIFGGQSGEHDVSLMSVQSVIAALDPDRYEGKLFGIDKQGRWMFDHPLERLLEGENAPPDAPRWPSPEQIASVDIFFPVLHGPNGEDGVIQGFFEMADVPYVGNGVLASAVAMDKALAKKVFQAHGLPQTPWETVSRAQLEHAPDYVLARLESSLDYPMFTKPANLGSSVGVRKATNRSELLAGLREAAEYDIIVVVEEAVPYAREIEVSILGNEHPKASVPGEIIPSNEFYDYEAKYLSGASEERIPAPISPQLTARVQELAIAAFKAIHGSGLARVDFLLNDATGELFLNEVNTMPGFTRISMYPKLWAASGLSYPELIHQLIQLGFQRHRQKHALRTTYSPPNPSPTP